MKQVFISVGNSDNKLTQAQWSEFVQRIGRIIEDYATQVYPFAEAAMLAPSPAAWLIDCTDYMAPSLKNALTECRQKYDRCVVTWLEGENLCLFGL
jgi:hypothetical protein